MCRGEVTMSNYQDELTSLKKIIIKTVYETGEGHLSPAFSCLDILLVLYDGILRIDENDVLSGLNDRFVLSKGHAAVGLYALLARKGFFQEEELKTFGKFHSRLGGHPDRNKVPGVDVSTGSLGHGLPNAVGMAYGFKLRHTPQKVYVVAGDGEMNEGSMWESIMIAAQMKLGNLTCIIDNNRSIERAVIMNDFAEKFRAFHWDTEIVDGHDPVALNKALTREHDMPLAVVANTIKGHGCRLMEENPLLWHHKRPTDGEFASMIEELENEKQIR